MNEGVVVIDAAIEPDRETGGRWKTGKSPNPGGKTKVERDVLRQVREAAGSYAPEALKVLVNILRNRRALSTTRIAAANAILDRAVGRPAQAPTFADGSALPVIDADNVSDLEIARHLAFMLQLGVREIEQQEAGNSND